MNKEKIIEELKDLPRTTVKGAWYVELGSVESLLLQALTQQKEELKRIIEGKKYKTLGTSNEWLKSENTPNGLAQHYTDEFTAKWHNAILDDIISELNHQ